MIKDFRGPVYTIIISPLYFILGGLQIHRWVKILSFFTLIRHSFKIADHHGGAFKSFSSFTAPFKNKIFSLD